VLYLELGREFPAWLVSSSVRPANPHVVRALSGHRPPAEPSISLVHPRRGDPVFLSPALESRRGGVGSIVFEHYRLLPGYSRRVCISGKKNVASAASRKSPSSLIRPFSNGYKPEEPAITCGCSPGGSSRRDLYRLWDRPSEVNRGYSSTVALKAGFPIVNQYLRTGSLTIRTIGPNSRRTFQDSPRRLFAHRLGDISQRLVARKGNVSGTRVSSPRRPLPPASTYIRRATVRRRRLRENRGHSP